MRADHPPEGPQFSRALLVCAVLVIVCFWIDILQTQVIPWHTLAVRVVWASLIACGWYVGSRADAKTHHLILRVVAVTSPIPITVIALGLGPIPNAMFQWTLCLPLAAAAVIHEDSRGVILTGVVGAASSALALLYGGHPTATIVTWPLLMATSTILALLACARFRQLSDSLAQRHAQRLAAIEELAESERRRAHAERLATLGRLAAGVAHEINNPLAWVISNVRFLQEDPRLVVDDPKEAADLLQETLQGLARIQEIVGDLKIFGRSDAPPACGFAVEEALDEALRLASVSLRGVTTVDRGVLQPDLMVLADRRRLVQVLVNLLVNAADALAAHPRDVPPKVKVSVRAAGDRVELVVEDNGPGVPEEVRARVFDPFFTTKDAGRGTGLGLAISRESVVSMGGTIELDTADGGGARFVLTLPTAAALPVGEPLNPAA